MGWTALIATVKYVCVSGGWVVSQARPSRQAGGSGDIPSADMPQLFRRDKWLTGRSLLSSSACTDSVSLL